MTAFSLSTGDMLGLAMSSRYLPCCQVPEQRGMVVSRWPKANGRRMHTLSNDPVSTRERNPLGHEHERTPRKSTLHAVGDLH